VRSLAARVARSWSRPKDLRRLARRLLPCLAILAIALAMLALAFQRHRAGWSLAHYGALWLGALALYAATVAAGSALDGGGTGLVRELRPQLLAVVAVLTLYVLARA
jgi:hypothetical protein